MQVTWPVLKNKKAQQSTELERFDCIVSEGRLSICLFFFSVFFFFPLLTKKSIRLQLATSERDCVAQK